MQNQYRSLQNFSSFPHFLFITTILIATTPSAFPATLIVELIDATFSPSTLQIDEGDTVQWDYVSGLSHTITSGTHPDLDPTAGNLFEGSVFANTSFSYTFNDAGTYSYFCQQHYGGGILGTITVVVATDTTPPVITIEEPNPVTVLQNSTYVDAGATALDDTDGTITNNINTDLSSVNTGSVGSFDVTYSVMDEAGNEAIETRTVTVIAADNVYVNGSNDSFEFGTIDFPLKTIAEAVEIAATDATIHIAPGTYDETFVGDFTISSDLDLQLQENSVGTVRIGTISEALISISGFKTRSLPLKLKDNQDE